MGIRPKSWTQSTWERPGVQLHHQQGDFYNLNNLLLSPTAQQLQRAPAWSNLVSFPSGFGTARAAFFDRELSRRVFIGVDDAAAPTKIVSCYFTDTWNANGPYDLIAGITGLGGTHLQNTIHWAGYLYVIDSSGNVHRGTDYTSALSSFYTGGDASILTYLADQLYLVTDSGDIHRLNESAGAFETYYTSDHSLSFRFAAPFWRDLILCEYTRFGSLDIHRLSPNTPALSHLLHIPAPGNIPDYALPWAAFDDKLYFTTGQQHSPNNVRTIPIYEFDGGNFERLANPPQSLGFADSWTVNISAVGGTDFIGGATANELLRLFSWQHRLMYTDVVHAIAQLKSHTGTGFTDLGTPALELPPASFTPIVGAIGNELICTAYTNSGEGVHYAGQSGYASPATFTSSWLDFDEPDRPKRLNEITAVLEGKSATATVKLEYRTDGASTWVTAETETNSEHVTANVHSQFYTLQIRVTITDTASTDIKVLEVGVGYSG